MSGPVPSNLVLLSNLKQCPRGTKVRFLGCVDEYVVRTATLALKHDYPPNSPSIIANVNVEHVLESLKHNELDVGAWINVIGNVEQYHEKAVSIQAVAVWSAGNIDLVSYQNAIEKRTKMG